MQQQLGSGKTAVLVERIIQKILTQKIDIDRLLVVTFTNAAASEMRERVLDAIDKKLEVEPENQMLQRQINLLNKASICTIDSFCLEVVKNYFYELDNISPNFRIGDTTEIELLKQEVLEELFEKKYDEENADFAKLLNVYTTYRDDTPLKELILKIDNYMQSNPFPQKWLKEKVEMYHLEQDVEKDFSETPWGKVLLQEVEEELIDAISSLEQAKEKIIWEPELEKFVQTLQNDINMLQNLKNSVNHWDETYQKYQNLSFITWPRQKVDSMYKEEAKKIRDDVKKKLQKRLDKILNYSSVEANQDILDMYQILKKLENLILEYQQEFEKKKREKNIVDFSDVEHFALQILCHQTEEGMIEKTAIAKAYEEKFEEIAIDEYQDSNLVQEYILKAISRGNNIFMVGDVKQSIYKFRQAMPELFLSKYASYPLKEKQNGEENLKIQLFKNFRSRENVLQVTNLVFQNIMSPLLGDVDYNKEEYLNLGADYEVSNQDLKAEINVIDLTQKYEAKQDGRIKVTVVFDDKGVGVNHTPIEFTVDGNLYCKGTEEHRQRILMNKGECLPSRGKKGKNIHES